MRPAGERVGNHGRVAPPGTEPVGPVEGRRVDSRQPVIIVFNSEKVDGDKIDATYKDGILKVVLPKTEESSVKKIAVH